MLVFNELNKYETSEKTILSSEETILDESSKSSTKEASRKKNKLTKTNIKFLKSLGFKLTADTIK